MRGNFFRELTHVMVEAERSHSWLSASWRPRDVGRMAQPKCEGLGPGKLMVRVSVHDQRPESPGDTHVSAGVQRLANLEFWCPRAGERCPSPRREGKSTFVCSFVLFELWLIGWCCLSSEDGSPHSV